MDEECLEAFRANQVAKKKRRKKQRSRKEGEDKDKETEEKMVLRGRYSTDSTPASEGKTPQERYKPQPPLQLPKPLPQPRQQRQPQLPPLPARKV